MSRISEAYGDSKVRSLANRDTLCLRSMVVQHIGLEISQVCQRNTCKDSRLKMKDMSTKSQSDVIIIDSITILRCSGIVREYY